MVNHICKGRLVYFLPCKRKKKTSNITFFGPFILKDACCSDLNVTLLFEVLIDFTEINIEFYCREAHFSI